MAPFGHESLRRMRTLRCAPRVLSEEQVAHFDREGFLLPLHGCDAAEAAAVQDRIETAERSEQQAGMALFYNAHLQHRWWHELCTRPEVLDVVEDLLGPNVLLWKSQLWIKEQGPAYVGWHQDATYWGLDPPDSVNVWMAITDVTPSHGPLQHYARSHAAALPTLETYTVDNILTRGQNVDWAAVSGGLDDSRICSAVLKPGEFSVHHLCCAHASQPNHGPGRRIGFNMTFVSPNVGSIRPEGASAMLVRGSPPVAALRHWRLELPPVGERPTEEEARRTQEKNYGQSLSLLSNADMAKFKAVSKERASRNLPKHVATGGEGAFGAALAKL